jgi:hypothetical protein
MPFMFLALIPVAVAEVLETVAVVGAVATTTVVAARGAVGAADALRENIRENSRRASTSTTATYSETKTIYD